MNAIEYLFGLEFHGHKLGLDNIVALADALGAPQRAFRTVHVAGTNGKGSVCAMVDAALLHAGHRSACYTSPHLIDLEERFRIAGRSVSREALSAAVEEVRHTAERLLRAGRLRAQPTFFEVATATAFLLFRNAHVEVAVLEVGLGGRLDATNVAAPDVGVITNIALEHQQYLGNTLAAIAAEKAGIVKSGMCVVSGERGAEARAVIRDTCTTRGARLIEAHADTLVDAFFEAGRMRATISTPRRAYGACLLGLRGRHQVDNAVVAVRALEALDETGLAVPDDAVVSGLRDAVWPGRLDMIAWPGGGEILVDAAHNPAGARTLAAYLAEVHAAGVAFVVGTVRDKDVRAMLEAWVPLAQLIVATEPPTPRATPAKDLAAHARAAALAFAAAGGAAPHVIVQQDSRRAVEAAVASGRTVVVAGSIFLAGTVLAHARRPIGSW